MDEYRSRSGQPLQNESFAAEESRTQPFHQRDIELNGGLRDHKSVALHENTLARFQIEGLDPSRITAREADFAVAALRFAGVDAPVRAVKAKEFGAPAARPAYSVLSNRRYREMGLPAPRSWEAALAELLAR